MESEGPLFFVRRQTAEANEPLPDEHVCERQLQYYHYHGLIHPPRALVALLGRRSEHPQPSGCAQSAERTSRK